MKSGFRVSANFDSRLINAALMRRVLSQLEITCVRLLGSLSKRIDEIVCLPDEELNQIWQQNRLRPISLDRSMRSRADSSLNHGSVYPPMVVPWICDPRYSTHLSPVGSVGELFLEGALLSSESVESPPWLIAGSPLFSGRTGKVHATGDMVRLDEDGRMIFMGRKENNKTLHGHTINVEDLEAHLTKYLPDNVRVAAAIHHPTQDSTQQLFHQELLVFIDQQPSGKDLYDLFPQKTRLIYGASCEDSFETAICASIPRALVLALKKLSKICRDRLPSYMAPSAYVVVEALPTTNDQINRKVLNDLAAKIPLHLLCEIRERFEIAWASTSEQTNLTLEEDTLRSAWAKVLRVNTDQISVDDNFFRLGGDSVLAMKLVSSVRSDGHSLTIADIFNNMRLGDAAKVFRLNKKASSAAPPYMPFSLLDNSDTDKFLFQVIQPKLANPSWLIQDVLPVTTSQMLDIRATTQAPRTSVQYTMLYFNNTINQDQLFKASQKLVDTHAILRTVFIEHESTLLQVVITGLDISWTTQRIESDIEKYVASYCDADIEFELPLGSPFFKLVHVLDENGRQCLIIRLSHAQYDGISLPRILQDLEHLYTGKSLAAFQPFSSYMARISDDDTEKKGLQYWRDLLSDSAPSALQGTPATQMKKSISKFKPINLPKSLNGITTANLLIASWSVVLARRLRSRDVTFGNITSGRNIEYADMTNVIGPCYQFTPVRVKFQPNWTGIDLLTFVKRQIAQSAAHDFLGVIKISKECTQWQPKGQFFDSITHHQDFEDFDTMPFAGGSCRVDIRNPHGYPAYPLKVVTVVDGGETSIGVVGGESDLAFVEAVLDDLHGAITILSNSQSRCLFTDDELFSSG